MTLNLKPIECPNCGAPVSWDGTYGKPVTCAHCGSLFIPGPTDVDDIWLMTDPVARARYEANGTLAQLEHDIRYEVLRGGTWSPLDRAVKAQLDQLEQAGIIRKLASFWFTSPFPPVYRARQEGQFVLDGKRIPFRKGQEMIWACPMTRDTFNLDVPLLIGNFEDETVQRLCGEMREAMKGRLNAMGVTSSQSM